MDMMLNYLKIKKKPKNAVKHNLDTPCAYTGKCNDCQSEQRICGVEVIHHRKPTGTNISLFIINEDVGF